MPEGEKPLPSDRPPGGPVLDVKREGGKKKVPLVATVNLEGGLVFQAGAGGELTPTQEAQVQALTRGKIDPDLQRRLELAEKIAEGKRKKSGTKR